VSILNDVVDKEMQSIFTQTMKNKENLYALLVSTYVVSLAIANILAGIIIALPFGFTLAAGTLVFPLTYIASNLISEVFGYKKARFTALLAIIINVLLVIVYQLTLLIPNPAFWQNEHAYQIVLGAVPRIFAASTLASFFASWFNDVVFERLLKKEKGNFTTRSMFSSLLGQMLNSAIFIPIAFLGTMPMDSMITMYFVTVIVRLVYQLVLLPLTNRVVKNVEKW